VNETVVFSQAAVESKLTVVNDARQYLETLAVTDQPSAQVAADFLGDLQDELKSIRSQPAARERADDPRLVQAARGRAR
jgi:hypothetical protein